MTNEELIAKVKELDGLIANETDGMERFCLEEEMETLAPQMAKLIIDNEDKLRER